MKLLFDLTPLADNFSGVERFALNISKEYIERNDENRYVLLFKREIHSCFKSISHRSNVECVVLKPCNKFLFSQVVLPWKLYQIRADAYFFLAFPEPILFFHNNMYTAIHDMCCWDIGHTMTFKSRFYYRLSNRHSMRFCKKIITISSFSQQRIEAIGKVSSDRIIILYCGIGKQFVHISHADNQTHRISGKYGLPQSYILSLSTIEPRKNLNLLLHAYEILRKDDPSCPALVLAGRKGWKMENMLNGFSNEIVKHIHFTGFVEDADLPYLYSSATFFVFPSKYEGFGIPPLEAMACGTPVLSSDATSLPEVLGDAALYFPSGDCMALKSEIEDILHLSEQERSERVYIGRQRAMQFDWAKEASKLELIIRGIHI